jgi:hypothetical protein
MARASIPVPLDLAQPDLPPQAMGEAPGSKLKEAVEIIASCYPEEIVKYYSPSYSQQLLEKLESMTTGGAGTTVH